MFIELESLTEGRPILINLDHIASILPIYGDPNKGTSIYLSVVVSETEQVCIDVKNQYKDIIDMMGGFILRNKNPLED